MLTKKGEGNGRDKNVQPDQTDFKQTAVLLILDTH